MSNKTYDICKWIAQYLLPALATLYFSVYPIWGLQYGEQIVSTITTVNAFLVVRVDIRTANFNNQIVAEKCE